MKRAITVVMGVVWLSLSAIVSAAGAGVVVENAWIREAPPAAKALAGYMVVKNTSSSDKILIGASSSDFANVMLHRTIVDNGMAKMIHQTAITIPAKGEVVFEPNGYHVMLMGPTRVLKAGDKVEISLKFKDGEVVKVMHEVRAADVGQAMGHEMGHAMDHGSMNHNH